MKSVSFLRNTWKKRENGKSSPVIDEPHTAPLADGFWDVMDRAAPTKRSSPNSMTPPRRLLRPRPSLPLDVMAGGTGGLSFPLREHTAEEARKRPDASQGELEFESDRLGNIRTRAQSLHVHQPCTPRSPAGVPNPKAHSPVIPTSPTRSVRAGAPSPPLCASPTDFCESPLPRTNAHPTRAEILESRNASKRLRPKRSMPELDGVWQGFLEEVDEDAVSVRDDSPRPPRKSSMSYGSGRAPIKQYLADLPPSPARSPVLGRMSPARPLQSGSPVPGSPTSYRSPTRPRIVTASSTESHSSLAYLSRDSPAVPSEEDSIHSDTSSISDDMLSSSPPDFPLSMFPVPPPLTAHRNISRASSYNQLSSSPTMTPDLTPVTTPVTTPLTPRFPQSSPPTTRKMGAPQSILKKPSGGIHVYAPPTPPLTPVSIGFPASHSHSPKASAKASLRPEGAARSTSTPQVYTVRSPVLHRPSSSDSTSEQSSSKTTSPTTLRKRAYSRSDGINCSPLKAEVRTLKSHQAMGPPRSVSPAAEIQWGYAV